MTLEQIQALTDDEIRVRVAELMGWQVKATRGKYDLVVIDPNGFEVAWGNLRGRTPDELRLDFSHNLPNYPADLNACHEFERTMNEDECAAYQQQIDNPWGMTQDDYPAQAYWFHATARARCEAFLAVMQP